MLVFNIGNCEVVSVNDIEAKIVEVIKKHLLEDEYLMEEFHESDAGKLYVMRHSTATITIAFRMGFTTSKARYWLNKMHKNGALNKHTWRGGCTCWFPIGWDGK